MMSYWMMSYDVDDDELGVDYVLSSKWVPAAAAVAAAELAVCWWLNLNHLIVPIE